MALVDTNVLVVANARSGENLTCIDACVDCIAEFTEGRSILHLDTLGHILEEYGRNILHGTPQGVGDAFFVWATTFQATPSHCRQVKITEDSKRGYLEFPIDSSLSGFDQSDRKFVAVAIASKERPAIFNATDSDWQQYSAALAPHVDVRELCE
jgi:hypothetical protein